MYGTVARMRLKAGKEQELQQILDEDLATMATTPGVVFSYTYRMDADPQDYYVVVAFESKETYQQNAASPDQHARYERYRALVADEPEWHDGEVVHAYPR